jgi:hypothetical protein
MVARKGKRRKCSCGTRAAVSRGKCARCLKAIWARIRSGELTEREAVDQGLLAPAQTPGRPLKRRLAKSKR